MKNELVIKEKHRPLSTYICGNPGSGKSSLLQRMVLKDICNNEGVCVIDPTAQLIKTIIDYIPKKHLDRVVHFITADPISLDFFSYRDDDEKQELVEDLSNIIDLSTAPIAKNYIRRIIKALFEANAKENIYTLFDIPRFIQDPVFMQSVLSRCPPEREYDFPPHIKIQPDSISAILLRLSEITDDDMMKTILGAKKGQINVADMVEQNKIFLVDLNETRSNQIIGSIIAAKIQHAIFARRHLPDVYTCKPYYLYIDECDVILKFAESRFTAILGRARKYKLGMTIANPIPSDLPTDIKNGLGKIGNLVLFNLDARDAQIFKSKILPYETDSLVNLPEYHALFRTNNRVYSVKTPHYLPKRPTKKADYIRLRMIRDYPADPCKTEPKTDNSVNDPPADQIKTRGMHALGSVLRTPSGSNRPPYQKKAKSDP